MLLQQRQASVPAAGWHAIYCNQPTALLLFGCCIMRLGIHLLLLTHYVRGRQALQLAELLQLPR
jgi:hypothetical protein